MASPSLTHSDRALAAQLGRNGLDRIAQRFDIGQLADEYLDVLQRLGEASARR